ncbi:ADP-ribosylglycohydrolase [compost metagenome]
MSTIDSIFFKFSGLQSFNLAGHPQSTDAEAFEDKGVIRMRCERFTEFLRGVALGDSLGMLPENLDRQQVARMFGGQVTQKMPFGRGFVSDETEQALLTARAIMRAGETKPKQAMRGELFAWLATLPPGIGSSTLKAILKLALTSESRLTSVHGLGVASAGNGPLLRAATMGLLLDISAICDIAPMTTLMTHDHPDALACSVTTALIFDAAQTAHRSGRRLSSDMYRDAASLAHASIEGNEGIGWRDEVRKSFWSLNPAFHVIDLVSHGSIPLEEGLARIGCADGVSGYIRDTMLAALMIAARHSDDVNAAADAAIGAGGDTDSVAALTCGLVAVVSAREQDFSRLKLWRDPYGLARDEPPSSRDLLASVSQSRRILGTLAEHLALTTLFAVPFLGRRTWIRLGFGRQ